MKALLPVIVLKIMSMKRRVKKEEMEELDDSVNENNLKVIRFRRFRDLSPEPADLTP